MAPPAHRNAAFVWRAPTWGDGSGRDKCRAAASASMTFSVTGLLVLFHVLFASLWFGGGVYQVRIVGGTLMAAGQQAGGFMAALARRKGIGWYFALTGGLAILFGGALYGKEISDGAIAG